MIGFSSLSTSPVNVCFTSSTVGETINGSSSHLPSDLNKLDDLLSFAAAEFGLFIASVAEVLQVADKVGSLFLSLLDFDSLPGRTGDLSPIDEHPEVLSNEFEATKLVAVSCTLLVDDGKDALDDVVRGDGSDPRFLAHSEVVDIPGDTRMFLEDGSLLHSGTGRVTGPDGGCRPVEIDDVFVGKASLTGGEGKGESLHVVPFESLLDTLRVRTVRIVRMVSH